MSQKQIPTKLNKGHQEKQNTFLVRMSKQFSSKGPDDQPEVIGVYRSPQDISILLRKLGATYNPEKEQVLEELLEKTIQQSLRDKWLERMKPVPPEKCPMPDCEGIISRRSRSDVSCSLGGRRHILVFRVAAIAKIDPIELLQAVELVATIKAKVQQTALDEWREWIKKGPKG